jgi:hypothetical protein
MKAQTSTLIPMTVATDFTGNEGKFIKADGTLVDGTTDVPYAVVDSVNSADGLSITAEVLDGAAGLSFVKLGGTVAVGDYLLTKADATVEKYTTQTDRVIVARAAEAGDADELVRACLISPTDQPAAS